MKQSKLGAIADNMQAFVSQTGRFAYKRLPAGLEIVMQRKGGQWRLALAREAPAMPSDVEVEVCAREFKVPPDAKLERTSKNRQHPKTGRYITYYIAELTWREYDQ